MLFMVTGLGLVIYMNFRPGFGRWFNLYPLGSSHEVRERDYFFVVSFVVWGLWAGLGLLTLARDIARRLGGWTAARLVKARLAPSAVFLLAFLPFALNSDQASRRHGPDAALAGDFG